MTQADESIVTPLSPGRLAYIECDSCTNKIRPHPEIAGSGWMKTGQMPNYMCERDWCPDCWGKRPLGVD
jgi:hypothetical protein